MVNDSFEHIVQARNPSTYFALGAFMALAYVIWVLGLPLIAELAVAVFLAVVLHRLTVNPKTGFRITERAIECLANGETSVIALHEVDGAGVIVLYDGSTRCWLNLRGGGIQALPGVTGMDAGQLIRELRDRGIWVSQSPVA
ncbi:MAG: hypothetical protein H6901_11695 [Rhodobacteraceae bacterium]|nr:hypothetical protein [Paracoccaceae bacterium]MCP5342868.1 hypothetical protein [Paracoccaceae bacterium]